MGYAARLNKRSLAGGKPLAYVALHRLWRAVDFFQGDHRRFVEWLDSRAVSDAQRERLEFLWTKRYPAPLVTLETEMPTTHG